MEGIVAMFTASSSRASSARAAVVERLRRVLFSPQRLLTAGTLACVLACGGFAAGEQVISYNEKEPTGRLSLENLDDSLLKTGIGPVWLTMSDPNDGVSSITGRLKVEDGTLWIDTNGEVVYKNIEVGDIDYALAYESKILSEYKPTLFFDNGNHTVNGTVNVNYYASLMFEGQEDNNSLTLNDKVVVDFQSILDITGNANFKTLDITTESEGDFVANNGKKITFTDTVNVDDISSFYAFGQVEINGTFNLKNDSEATFYKAEDQTGKIILNDNVIIDDSVLAVFTDTDFNKNVVVKNNGELSLFPSQTQNINLAGDVTIDQSKLYSFGNVNYSGNLTFQNSATGFFTQSKNAQGTNTFSADSSLTVENKSEVYANVSQLNVDIKLNNAGELFYTNLLTEDTSKDSSFFITYDENRTPTVLSYNTGRENIKIAYDNNDVISRDISGAGSIYFSTVTPDITDITSSSNGYTVVIDSTQAGENANQMFQYTGNTTIGRAFVAVKGGTDFGDINTKDQRNQLNVIGECYIKVEKHVATDNDGNILKDEKGNPILVTYDDKGQPTLSANVDGEYKVRTTTLWDVKSSGMLGFYRDNAAAEIAPSVSAKLVYFHDGDVYNNIISGNSENHTGGARIWIDTSYNGDAKNIKLGAINADEIIFGRETDIWYDGISKVESDVAMTFDLNAPAIITYTNDKTPNQDKDGRYYDSNNRDRIAAIFAKPLVAAEVEPSRTMVTPNDREGNPYPGVQTPAGYTVTVNAIDVADFAKNEKMTQAEQDYAAKFDEARLRSDANVQFNDALYNENDGNKVRQTIHNLSLLGHQMLNQHSHFGNPSSAFFGGAAISGEAKRGQQARNDEPLPNPSAINTQEQEYNPTRGVWASFTHTNVDGAAYQDSGITMHGYDLERSGVIGGIKRQYDATLSGGLFFGLTMPEMYSKANLENSSSAYVRTQMEMTDFQFAGHLEKIIADNWELCLFVGGGHQSMDWERNVNLDKFNTTYKADGTGNTLTGTAYLAYRVDMNDRWTIRPTVGIDSEHSWLYNFEETGGALGSLSQVGYNNQMLAQRYRYDDTYYNRNLARVGFTTAFDGAQGWAGLNGRVFYSTQLGGKPAPLLSYNTVGDVNNANYVDLRFEDMNSHVMGSDAFSVGGGGYMHLNKTKTLTANGDVNAIWYKNASTLNVTGGVSYRF